MEMEDLISAGLKFAEYIGITIKRATLLLYLQAVNPERLKDLATLCYESNRLVNHFYDQMSFFERQDPDLFKVLNSIDLEEVENFAHNLNRSEKQYLRKNFFHLSISPSIEELIRLFLLLNFKMAVPKKRTSLSKSKIRRNGNYYTLKPTEVI
jgi:hypothetical protein